eukprot:4987625-Pleurochrysis_carterae.AAC.1
MRSRTISSSQHVTSNARHALNSHKSARQIEQDRAERAGHRFGRLDSEKRQHLLLHRVGVLSKAACCLVNALRESMQLREQPEWYFVL